VQFHQSIVRALLDLLFQSLYSVLLGVKSFTAEAAFEQHIREI
jgi:hypothetical protein